MLLKKSSSQKHFEPLLKQMCSVTKNALSGENDFFFASSLLLEGRQSKSLVECGSAITFHADFYQHPSTVCIRDFDTNLVKVEK